VEQPESTIDLPLTLAEVNLLRTALGLLEATLGREEADELDAVQALQSKLERLAPEQSAR
jgi:hypothetical protein